jgi:serine/threonine protein kinase/tetratricopeptide (TPR) repeat protein
MTVCTMEIKQPANLQPESIGPYAILESLGRGGMGEVYLAQDPAVGRKVALKRIRPELQKNKTILYRFLREAEVASALTHPSIVPILTIHTELPDVYYTMPYIEGETLRHILKHSREQEKKGDPLHPIGRSIPALARIFLQVCEAIAYTHSKGILHRDLKPENIIVGKYGEVMILDWGIADFIDQLEKEKPLSTTKWIGTEEDLTRPGKVTGTLAYMAPERLKNKSSSVQTDIYALGVILYQMLTLQLPFQRKTIAAFRKMADSEQLIDPIEMAPYRDIPHQLAYICKKCLLKNASERFKSVTELIGEVKNYIEGKPEWIETTQLDLKKKTDWQFQENILLAKHIAITRNLNVTEWAEFMVSRASFAHNIRLEAKVCVTKKSQGLGFLLCVPDAEERKALEEGYCLWIGSNCLLFRNNVQVMSVPDLYLNPDHWHHIAIEKVDDYIKFYLDGRLKFSFLSHIPTAGRHIGFLHKDGEFEVKQWKVFDGSHNVMVGCLAVPDAFLGHKLYDWALQEYRRIGQCFPGRMEGREALFRAGLTLLEKAKAESQKTGREKLFHLALKEFEKLYRTPGAPLEYLGKSLVYAALEDFEEEAKCLELALRKFPKHPLLGILKEHIIYRMHESSLNHREAAYRIILLAIRHIPELLKHPDTIPLIESLQKNWQSLPFMEKSSDTLRQIAIQLAFWLAKKMILVEIAKMCLQESPVPEILVSNAIYALIELDGEEQVRALPLDKLSEERQSSIKHLLNQKISISGSKENLRAMSLLLQKVLCQGKTDVVLETIQQLKKNKLSKEENLPLSALEIWAYLLTGKAAEASVIFKKFPRASFNREDSPLHFAYGTWLYMTKGPETASLYFNSTLETPHPPTTILPSHFLADRLTDHWMKEAFWWEKKELHRQIDLFYKCVGKKNDQTT